ncbi:MAG: DUF433 domain-containing protein [Verrucomicrobiota bacterium]
MNERISINPNVCHGKPVIRGTRVLVGNILGALGSGDTIDEIIEDYPNISREDVLAAIDFGGQLSRFEEGAYEVCTS